MTEITVIILWDFFSSRDILMKELAGFLKTAPSGCCKVQTDVCSTHSNRMKQIMPFVRRLLRQLSPALFKKRLFKKWVLSIFYYFSLAQCVFMNCLHPEYNQWGNLPPCGAAGDMFLILWVSLLPHQMHWAPSVGPTALMTYGGGCTQTYKFLQHSTHIQTYGLGKHIPIYICLYKCLCVFVCRHTLSTDWGAVAESRELCTQCTRVR